MRPKAWTKVVYALLAVGSVANGLWMLLAPAHWFARLPGVADTGPLNPHLVRDFGASYLLVGLIILAALARGTFTRTAHFWIAFFFWLHAAIHLWDLRAGRLSVEHWAMDFPGVFFPALLLLALSLPIAWEQRARG